MKRFLSILCAAGALALMIFTKGAVLIMTTGPNMNQFISEHYSYFNPITLSNENFPPLITAILTCLALILGFVAIKSKACRIILVPLTLVTFVVSVLPPFLYGLRWYSLLGAAISLLLLLSAVFALLALFGKKKGPAAPAPGAVPPPPPPPPQQ